MPIPSKQKVTVIGHKNPDTDSICSAIAYAALKNRLVYCDRGDIPMPEGGHFVADLIGLKVIDAADGRVYGVLWDVLKTGPHDQYEIERPDGSFSYMPVVNEFVSRIDLDAGIFVTPIPGMFDEI